MQNCFNRDAFWRYAICRTHNPSSWPSCSGCARLKVCYLLNSLLYIYNRELICFSTDRYIYIIWKFNYYLINWLQRRNLQFIDFGDSRILCPDCQATTIMDITKLKPLVKKMHKFYEERLNLKVPKNVPILLVDTYEMNKTFSTGGTVSSRVPHDQILYILFH